jgi:hypothetical protein
MSAGKAKAAPAAPAPRSAHFGVEIEMFVKIKPRLEVIHREKQRVNADSLPEHWQLWNFDLKNNYNDDNDDQVGKAILQRRCVCGAAQEAIDRMLGPDNGWTCELDLSLKERLLKLPPDPRKWCM